MESITGTKTTTIVTSKEYGIRSINATEPNFDDLASPLHQGQPGKNAKFSISNADGPPAQGPQARSTGSDARKAQVPTHSEQDENQIKSNSIRIPPT